MSNKKIPFAVKFNVYLILLLGFLLLVELIMLPTLFKDSDFYGSFAYLFEGALSMVSNMLIIFEALIVGYLYFAKQDIRKIVKLIVFFTIVFVFLILLQTDFSDPDDLFGSVISIFLETAPVIWMVASRDVRRYVTEQ